jgi:hypothetical protein
MGDAKTRPSWSQRARGEKDSIENGQPEEFINGLLKSGIACFADWPMHHHLNGCGSASIETLLNLIGIRSNDDALVNESALAIVSADCNVILEMIDQTIGRSAQLVTALASKIEKATVCETSLHD